MSIEKEEEKTTQFKFSKELAKKTKQETIETHALPPVLFPIGFKLALELATTTS